MYTKKKLDALIRIYGFENRRVIAYGWKLEQQEKNSKAGKALYAPRKER